MMKRRNLMLTLVLAVAMLLSACGGGSDAPAADGKSSVVGKWFLTGAEMSGQAIPEDALGTLGVMSIELKDDGTASYSMLGQEAEGTYTEENGKVKFEDGTEVTLENNQLIFADETSATKLIFTKQ